MNIPATICSEYFQHIQQTCLDRLYPVVHRDHTRRGMNINYAHKRGVTGRRASRTSPYCTLYRLCLWIPTSTNARTAFSVFAHVLAYSDIYLYVPYRIPTCICPCSKLQHCKTSRAFAAGSSPLGFLLGIALRGCNTYICPCGRRHTCFEQ